MSAVKLFGFGMSRSFRVLWMLEELGTATVPYRYFPVMPQSKEVLRHNPLGKVPILVDHAEDDDNDDDGFALYETVAIMNYLGDKYGSRSRDNKTIEMTMAGASTASPSSSC